MTQEEMFEDAKKTAKKAKTVSRMIIMLAQAKSPWFEENKSVIIEFIEKLKSAKEGEQVEVPNTIGILFKALPYSEKKREIQKSYDAYWEAWKGSNSVGVMLARLNTINRKHKYTQESDPDLVRIALCDALSQYSSRIIALEKNKFYIA